MQNDNNNKINSSQELCKKKMSARQKIMRAIMKNTNDMKPQIREAKKKKRWDILRGDLVQVIGGHKDSGKQGIVLEVIRKQDRVKVEGVNLYSKLVKGDPQKGTTDRFVQKEKTIHCSNVNLVDPVTKLPTRISRRYLEDGGKVRVAKKSGAVIPHPEILSVRKRPMRQVITDKDTRDEDVWASTYIPYDQR